ncbi:hypothetical protein ACF0H5_018605 [Mactra antiquata]
MFDVDTEVFSKVLATLSDPILQLIPDNKHDFLSFHLKSVGVEVLTEIDKTVVYLTGNLSNITAAQSILSEKLLRNGDELNATASFDNNDAEDIAEDNEADCENLVINNQPNHDDLVIAPEIPQETQEVVDDANLGIVDSYRKDKIHVTKSGRKVKVPLKLSSDSNITDRDKRLFDDEFEDNMDPGSTQEVRKPGRPRKWLGIERDIDSKECDAAYADNVIDNNNEDGNCTNDSNNKISDDDVNDNDNVNDGAKKKVETVFLNKDMSSRKKPVQKSRLKLKQFSEDLKYIKKYYEDRLPYKFFCDICSFKSKRQNHYETHMNMHKRNPNLKLHSCNKCDFTAVRLSVLQRHNISHVTDTRFLFSCSQCDFTTNVKKNLLKHENKHIKDEDFNINEKTHYSEEILQHSSVNTDEVYQCSQCEYQTKRKINYLRHHRNRHSDYRPHLCDLCGATFKRTDALKAHKGCHLEKSRRHLPFVCKICQKGFKSMAHLAEHRAVHSTERSFQCHICGQMFKTKAVQQRHLRGVHHKANVDQCNTCKRFFSSKYTLRRHLRQHDGDNLPNNGEIKTMQTLLPEAQQGSFVSEQDQVVTDEDANAIRTITISSENINDLNQKLQNLSSQMQNIEDISDVYIEGLENVDAGHVSVINLHGEDIGKILINSSEPSEYLEHVPQLSTDSTSQNIDTNQSINTVENVKLLQSLQSGHVIVSSSNINDNASINIQQTAMKQELSQSGGENDLNSELVNQSLETETVSVPSVQLLDINGQLITDASDGQIVEVVSHDGNTYHLKVNNSGNILSLETVTTDNIM